MDQPGELAPAVGPSADFVVDLENGRVTGTSPLRRLVEIDIEGHAVETPHAPNGAFTLELLARDRPGAYTGYLVSERVFRTNFNQLFLLGRADPAALEELHRDLPVLRAYRVRSTDPARPEAG